MAVQEDLYLEDADDDLDGLDDDDDDEDDKAAAGGGKVSTTHQAFQGQMPGASWARVLTGDA